MDKRIKNYLISMGKQEKRFDALYRLAASVFQFPECSMWILYYLVMEEKPMTQHELIERMMFSKQTIHSGVAWLVKKSWVQLETVPTARTSKNILLTDEGQHAADETVARILSAEAQAVKAMGKGKMDQYITLHEELSTLLCEAFADQKLTAAAEE